MRSRHFHARPFAAVIVVLLAGGVGIGCDRSPTRPHDPQATATPRTATQRIQVLRIEPGRDPSVMAVVVGAGEVGQGFEPIPLDPSQDGAGGLIELMMPFGGALPSSFGPLSGERATIDFSRRPGPDGRLYSADDIPFVGVDYDRVIDDEFSDLGIGIALSGTITAVGGGYNPDGTPAGGTNLLLDNIRHAGGGLGPLRMNFALPQTVITFDLFAQINALGTSAPVTLRDAQGAVIRTFTLTNAHAVLGGTAFFLAGRYRVDSATPFHSVEIGLTAEGGGYFFDNPSFGVDYRVRHVTVDVKQGGGQNHVNPGGSGSPVSNPNSGSDVQVTIMGDGSLDLSLIDVASLRFGPAGARDTDGSAEFKDVNRDGHRDLILKFLTRDTGIACGQTNSTIVGGVLPDRKLWGQAPIIPWPCH